MQIYESVIILNPTLNEEEAGSVIEKISDIVRNQGGEILKTDVWGKKRLAYEIGKHKLGHYVLLYYKAPTGANRKIEDYFKVLDTVLKFMIIKLGKKQIEALPREISGLPVPAAEAPVPAEVKEDA
jgi:small subunit ribosomal protein S6